MKLSKIMNSKSSHVATIHKEASVATAVAQLAEHDVGALVVSGDAVRVEGIVTERDIARALDRYGAALFDETVCTIMSTHVYTIALEEEVETAAVLMTNHRIRHLPVLKDGCLIGMVSIGDVVKSRIEELEEDRDYLFKYIYAR